MCFLLLRIKNLMVILTNVFETSILLDTVCNGLALDDHVCCLKQCYTDIQTRTAREKVAEIYPNIMIYHFTVIFVLVSYFTIFIIIKIYVCLTYNSISITPILYLDQSALLLILLYTNRYPDIHVGAFHFREKKFFGLFSITRTLP